MKPDIDSIRDEFADYVAKGMSYMEAKAMFDEVTLQVAIDAELFRGDSIKSFNMLTLQAENACGHETLFDLCVKASFEEQNKRDFEEQAVPLMMAGWTMETQNPTNSKEFWSQTQVMSLYWRAPSKRPGKPGRKYLSTNQAFNAMMKAS